jgi:glucose-6-phosphate isomerase
MLTKNISLINFQKIKINKKASKEFNLLKKDFLKQKNKFLLSLSEKYKYSFSKKEIKNYTKFNLVQIIGIGGSILGAKAIYYFLKYKIKKKFLFIDNLNLKKKNVNIKNQLNLVISKSGNTLETISNLNGLDANSNSIFITEDKNNYLRCIANVMKSEIFEHKDYIGGRYSVLSETGMLPANLMGLDCRKFKKLNLLINDKIFVNKLILSVSSILNFHKNKKTNSIILNYDESSQNLFNWYQQLVAESLGKKSKGILPIVSLMPRDNHSLMQLYLDGTKNNFFTFFMVEETKTNKIKKKNLLNSHNYLKNKSMGEILKAQFYATQSIFRKRKIPFRSFVVKKRNEEALGELFTFFILETIMLGKALNINPYDQPEVELIKKETIKNLINF